MNLFFGLNDATSPNLNSFLQNIFLPKVNEIDSESKPLSNKIASSGQDELDLNSESSRFTMLNKIVTNSLPAKPTSAELQQLWYKLAAKISKIHGIEKPSTFSNVVHLLKKVLTYSSQIKEAPKLVLERLRELRKQNSDKVLSNFDENVISPGLVAAIIFDEQMRADVNDQIQNESADAKWREGNIGAKTTIKASWFSTFQLLGDTSIGIAQIKPAVYIELVRKGYLKKPDGWAENSKFQIATKNILDESQNAEIVAAVLYRAYNVRAGESYTDEIFKILNDKASPLYAKRLWLASLYSSGIFYAPNFSSRYLNIALMAEAFDEYFSAR